ncbi:putative G-protein coupled receptor F59B2.13 [Pomacea canaliculata]|uniref:putative G-protein coupled receptor F59B2.13 n=1 Tax=Pomacea canaliculata TaxID=400727 RepID=UPI000D734D19|nr:putative G-protein coupled receptor F59B2.13 [Pomacea canaliculata]
MATWTQVPVLTRSQQTVWDMKQQQQRSGPCLVVQHTDVHTSTSQDNNTYTQSQLSVSMVTTPTLEKSVEDEADTRFNREVIDAHHRYRHVHCTMFKGKLCKLKPSGNFVRQRTWLVLKIFTKPLTSLPGNAARDDTKFHRFRRHRCSSDGVTWAGTSSTRVSDIQQQQQYTGPCQVVQHSGDASVDKDDIMSDQTEYWMTMVISAVLIPVFTVLGLPGNVLNAAVFYRQGLRERINVCLFSHAVVDIIVVVVLFLSYGEHVYRQLVAPSFVMLTYLPGLTGSVWASQFLSAVIASERCFCVVSPFHAKRLLKTSTMAAIIVVCCLLLIGGMCAVAGPKHTTACRIDLTTNITEEIVYVTPYYLRNKFILDIVDVFVYAAALPGVFLVVIIVTTCITAIKLRAALVWRRSTTFKPTAKSPQTMKDDLEGKMARKEVGVTLMLLATSMSFIVCITPNFVFQVATILVPDLSYSGRYYNLTSALWNLVSFFRVVNSSVNFFVYFKMGSKFRETVRLILK